MQKKVKKSYSKFTFDDLKDLGLDVVVVDLFSGHTIPPIEPSAWLKESLARGSQFSLGTEKAKSEFIIAPILNELYQNNSSVFSVYSGFNFQVDSEKGLQGFCDFLLVKLPLKVVPDAPIIAVVEAKLNDAMTAAVPQCAAEMYAAKLWNEKRGEKVQPIYGIITTGDNWLFLHYKGEQIIEVDKHTFSLLKLEEVLGILQFIVNQYK